MRGEIIQYDDGAGRGLISGNDGARYEFQRANLQQLTPVGPGMIVDFVPEGSSATTIFLLRTAGQGVAAPNASAAAPMAPRQPAPDLDPWQYFWKGMGKYADGTGRARRSEYWSFVLFAVLFLFLALVFDLAWNSASGYLATEQFFPAATVIVYLGLILPWICVTIRRLHDIGMSGWMYLLGAVLSLIYVGSIFLFVCELIPSQEGENKHGPNPKYVS